jgi:N-acyl-D-aspartate/D-glutamate deacylase
VGCGGTKTTDSADRAGKLDQTQTLRRRKNRGMILFRFYNNFKTSCIDTAIVNGAVVWKNGKPGGNRPGRILRRE